jgi:hypothetical protein
MTAHTHLGTTKAEFRRWVEERPEHERFALVNEEPRMMANVTGAHDAVVVNWIMARGGRIDRTKLSIHTGAYAVSANDLSYLCLTSRLARFKGAARSTQLSRCCSWKRCGRVWFTRI